MNRNRAFDLWFGDSQVVDENGDPLVVYHGTARPDRIGEVFRKDRATSGPMAFFTDDPEIASSYAVGKNDTSIESHGDYSEWFRANINGRDVPIGKVWWLLTAAQRCEISEKLPHVVYDRDEDEAPRLGARDEYGCTGGQGWREMIARYHGDVLQAAMYYWVVGGTLYDREEEFLWILELGGARGLFTFDDPWRKDSSVYAVYLSIQNPLVTSEIPKKVVTALTRASRTAPAAVQMSDPWNKRQQDPADWIQRLNQDARERTTYVWTSIPDWVTQTLIDLGYDGIQDVGGKYSGDPDHHVVWIPFEPTQVKSAIGNRGTFDPGNPNVLDGWRR